MKQHSTRPLRFSLSLAVRLCANVEGFANIPVHRFAKGQTSMTQPSLETTTTTTTQLNMYLDLDGKTGSAVAGPTNSRGNTNKKHPQDEPPKQQDLVLSPDTRKLGNLVVPSLGIGTISWSSDKRTSHFGFPHISTGMGWSSRLLNSHDCPRRHFLLRNCIVPCCRFPCSCL